MNQSLQNTNSDRLTRQQQKALHLWFKQVADECNSEGRTLTMILNKFIIDAPATDYAIKNYIWRPLQEAMVGKHSTTELLKKQEIDQIVMALNKFFAEELKMQLPTFPSLEDQNFDETYNKS
jgi:hypothetical protein